MWAQGNAKYVLLPRSLKELGSSLIHSENSSIPSYICYIAPNK
jgi:hypothetical protein